MRRTDTVHLGLMLGALALSYVLPFELLLLSYAVLGPAHYFTEISWLHDRSYFLPHRGFAIGLLAAGIGALLITDGRLAGIVIWSAFAGAAILATVRSPVRAAAIAIFAAAATAIMVLEDTPFVLAAILLPTFIHVCVFTLLFMTLGALKANSPVQFMLVGVYLTAIVLILIVPPPNRALVPALAELGNTYFGGVAPALGRLAGVPNLQFGGRITGLLSFVYTYHYLNWFIKADVIRWAAIPRPRLAVIAALSAASTALYFYSYTIGLTVLLAVSLGHVLLEFPLNGLSIRQLGSAALARRVRHSAA